jgi:membrane protein required for beta-lactamase induction
MTLISMLLAIAADRLLTHLHDYRHYDHFLDYVDWVRARLSGPLSDHVGGLLLVLSPLWLAVGLLQYWLSDWLFGLVGLLFYVAVLVYCLGPRDLAFDVATWCEVCDAGDSGLRQRAAGRLLHSDEALLEAPESGHQVANAVLVAANDRLFAVLFWFALLGPLGAVAYRSVAVLYQQRSRRTGVEDSVAGLYSLLIWLPARLLALGYALSGHFDAAIEAWRRVSQEYLHGVDGSERLLAVTGAGALGRPDDSDNQGELPARAAMRLVWRTLIIWLVVISVLTLAGWAG